jgi:hypothetical protein
MVPAIIHTELSPMNTFPQGILASSDGRMIVDLENGRILITDPPADPAADFEEYYEYEVPAALSVLLVDGKTVSMEDVAAVGEKDGRLYIVHANGAVTHLSYPFISWTAVDTFAEPDVDRGDVTEDAACDCEVCNQEPELDREALDGLKAKIRAENEQRAAVKQAVNEEPQVVNVTMNVAAPVAETVQRMVQEALRNAVRMGHFR